MLLRNHPLMTRKSGCRSWPPSWQPIGKSRGIVQGELAILELVSMHNLIPNKIFLSMQHLAERYTAVLQFDDGVFTKQLYPLLLENIEHSIKEIGDLDLSHLH